MSKDMASSGRSGAEAPSGHSAEPEPISVVSADTASVPNAARFPYCNADERWSVSFYGSPPAAQIWAGHPNLPDSRRPIAYFEFVSRTQRTECGAAIHALIDEHNSALNEAMRHVASAFEARRVETEGLDAKHESATRQGDAQTTAEPHP